MRRPTRPPLAPARPDDPAAARVAIVFGGRSAEHARLLRDRGGVLRAIDRDRYDVVPIGSPATAGGCSSPTTPSRCELAPGHVPEVDGTGAVARAAERPPSAR